MLLVILVLNGAASLGLVHRALHRRCHRVGVENDQTVRVSRGAADGLHKARLAAQEALLVRVEDGDERHLRQVEALAQQVDADEHIELAQPQVADELHALDGLHVRVHIAHAHAHRAQIFRQVLRHLLRQRRH